LPKNAPDLKAYWKYVERQADTHLRFGEVRGRKRRQQKGVDVLLAGDMLVGAFERINRRETDHGGRGQQPRTRNGAEAPDLVYQCGVRGTVPSSSSLSRRTICPSGSGELFHALSGTASDLATASSWLSAHTMV